MLAAFYRNTWFDRIVNATTLTTIASPEFFIAYILMFFLAVKLKLVPAALDGFRDDTVPEHLYKPPFCRRSR
jgi:peptide/nickel transport system permease protein